MSSLEWFLFRYDGNPYKKRKFGDRHVKREDYMKTQGDGHLQAKERGLRMH